MKRFVTEYQKPDGLYAGHVDALDFEHAQAICDARDKGEVVQGVLYAVIEATNFSDERADAMCKAFAETEDGEAPDASEFEGMECFN